MKRLILTRHAKAISHESGIADFDRPLAPRGHTDAALVANELAQRKFIPDRILTSPARRTLETSQIMGAQFGWKNNDLVMEEFLYGYYKLDDLIRLVSNRFPDTATVMIIGHNPTLSYLAEQLDPNFYHHLPTSAAVVMRFETDSWQEIAAETGQLEAFIYPKALRE